MRKTVKRVKKSKAPLRIIAGKNANMKDPERQAVTKYNLGADGRYYNAAKDFKPRAGLILLRSQILTAEILSQEELEKSIKYACKIRDSRFSGPRDILRAIEVLEAIRQRGIDIALYFDKQEREEKRSEAVKSELRDLVNHMGANEETRAKAEALAMEAINADRKDPTDQSKS